MISVSKPSMFMIGKEIDRDRGRYRDGDRGGDRDRDRGGEECIKYKSTLHPGEDFWIHLVQVLKDRVTETRKARIYRIDRKRQNRSKI